MTSPFSPHEQTTTEVADRQLARLRRRGRRRIGARHWAARLGTASMFVWAFSNPEPVGRWPLVVTLAAAAGTAIIGSRRMEGLTLAGELRLWSGTLLLGGLAFLGWVHDWPLAARVMVAEPCLLSSPRQFECAGWHGTRHGEEFTMTSPFTWVLHDDRGAPTWDADGASYSIGYEVDALWGDWYLVTRGWSGVYG